MATAGGAAEVVHNTCRYSFFFRPFVLFDWVNDDVRNCGWKSLGVLRGTQHPSKIHTLEAGRCFGFGVLFWLFVIVQ